MTAPASLRAEVEHAASVALARDGAGFSRATIAAAFVGRSVSRATIYRWIAGRLAARDGRPAPSAGGSDARVAALIADVAARAQALPDAIAPASLVLRLVEILGTAVALVRHARGPGGRFVRPRLALDACDLLRRTVCNIGDLARAEREAGDVALREPILAALHALLEPAPPGKASRSRGAAIGTFPRGLRLG